MNKILLNSIFEKPDKTVNVILTILPLAPLSMVSTMPGTFYKTLYHPSKYHLCGLFENILGWHFSHNDRKKIQKNMQIHYKKILRDQSIDLGRSEVGYLPLSYHLFDILPLNVKPAMIVYKDLAKHMRKRSDGFSHPKGTINISYELIPLKEQLLKNDNGTVKDEEIAGFYAQYRDKYPLYYTSTINRSFIVITSGNFKYNLKMTPLFYEMLNKAVDYTNMAYLGTNEGWVDIKIEKI